MGTYRSSGRMHVWCSNNPARRQGFRSQISDQYYLTSRCMAPCSFRGRRFSEHRRTKNNAAQRLHSFWGLVCVSICVASAAWRSSDGIISAVQGPEFLSVVGQGPKKQAQSIWWELVVTFGTIKQNSRGFPHGSSSKTLMKKMVPVHLSARRPFRLHTHLLSSLLLFVCLCYFFIPQYTNLYSLRKLIKVLARDSRFDFTPPYEFLLDSNEAVGCTT